MPLILIVDDAELSRTIVRRALLGLGYATLEAKTGQQGLEMATHYQPDCILLDLLLPELTGLEVMQALNTQQLNIPTIVITADTQDTTRQRCLNLGAIAVLYKPPQPAELQRTIQRALEYKEETVP